MQLRYSTNLRGASPSGRPHAPLERSDLVVAVALPLWGCQFISRPHKKGSSSENRQAFVGDTLPIAASLKFYPSTVSLRYLQGQISQYELHGAFNVADDIDCSTAYRI